MSANEQLAEMFSRMAEVMQLKGENTFKSLAFTKVARVMEAVAFDVLAAARAGALPPIEGVGESSRRVIEQMARDGRSSDYEALISSVPSGVLAMLQIPGLGPKTVALLWRERGLESVDALEKAASTGGLEGIKGLGEKKIAAILDGIRLLKSGMERRGWMDAAAVVADLLERLRADARVGEVQAAGSFRRRRETVGDVDLLCYLKNSADAQAVGDAFCATPGVEKVLANGVTKSSILIHGGFQVDLRIVPRASFGAAIQYFTGSKEHNVKLRGLAAEKGFTLNEWGLYRAAEYDRAQKNPGEAPQAHAVAGETEEGVYVALGLPCIIPELREDRGEIEAAKAGRLPRLIDRADIRGELHCHTQASDGAASIEEMVEAARSLGYEYIAITDHSPSSVIANGLSPDRLRAHIRAVHRVRDQVRGICVLAGSEVDIHPDGRLDYEDSVLAELDVVIASPHSSLKQDREKATQRLIRAMESRYVNIIGHPTGRLINQREGLPLDMEQIITVAAQTGTALEINAGWPRWDLNDLNARAACQHGAMLSINTDAHSTQGLGDMEMGIWVARRGWVEPKWVINALPLAGLRAFLKRKR